MNRPDKEKVKAFKKQVKVAFRELRKAGFIANMDFGCCASCASYELSEKAEQLKRDKVVFYHRQDETNLFDYGELSIRYFSTKEPAFENVQEERNFDASVGREVFEMLMKHGIFVKWNGDPNTVIIAYMEAKGDKT